MKRFLPYLKYFRPVRWHFAGGVLAALIYALASGLGLPLVTKEVFPIIFKSEKSPGNEALQYEKWRAAELGEPFQEKLVSSFTTDEMPSEKVSAYQRRMTNWLGEMEHSRLVLLSCLWLPLVFFLRALGGYFNTYLLNYCGYRVVEGIRDQVFFKMQSLPVSFFQKHQSGDLLARLTGDAELLRQTVTKVSGDLVKQPAQLIFALGFLIYVSVVEEGSFIAFISLLSIPLCVFPIRIVGRRLAKRARVLQNVAGDLSGQVAESLQAPMEIRAYNLQENVIGKFRRQVKDLIRYSMKVIKYRQVISPAVELVAAFGLSLALYLGSQRSMSLEAFMAIGMALYMSYEPIKKLGAVHSLMKQGEAALDRIEEVLHAEGELAEPRAPKTPKEFSSEIRFEKVSFAYGEEGGETTLKEISTVISPGECVALIGSSGAGKSTFANLIPRFYDVSDGSLKVSGQDVREWSKNELRDRIALVSQTPILFSGTIRENIRLGKPGATDEEVEEAAKKAFAHDFILKQENGYDTQVAEKGTKVSGGQRQRIAIARAFLKDAPILILDEATAALDNEAEARIQEALAKLIQNRTTIIIAHRLSTTKIAGRILEFDRGEIISERAEA